MIRTTLLLRLGLCVALMLRAVMVGAEPVEPDKSSPFTKHMHEHYQSVTQIQTAVIRGDLAAIREPAQWLADHPMPVGMPPEWGPGIDAMRSAARAVLAASDLKAAAMATSQMGNACGSCHTAHNVSDQFPWADVPEDEVGKLAHMQRHQWAADRMWEGLIGPSEDAWIEGAQLLMETPLSPQQLDAEDESAQNIRHLARRVHQLAANGAMEYEAAGKVAIYAEFLATCAACHTRLDPRPEE